MSPLRAALMALALWLVPSLAQAAPPPPVWVVDHATSQLGFGGVVSGAGFTGVFRRWDAVIRFSPTDLAHSSVAVTIDMTSAFTNNGDRDALLPDEDWFWTSHFPRATFVANSFTAIGPNRYAAAGVLTIKGAAKPLTLPFTLVITGATAKMNAQVTVNRLNLGVGQGEWQATDTVAAAVTVSANLTATRAK